MRIINNVAEAGPVDAILVPGGGLTSDGRPTPWVEARLDSAAEVHRALGGNATILTLSAGTTHKAPPLDARGFPIYESDAGALYLVRKHEIDPDAIWEDRVSLDTIGNATESRDMLEPTRRRKLLVVTSDFHAPRTAAIFDWVFGATPGGENYELNMLATPDVGLSEEALQARVAKERSGLESVRALAGRITTRAQVTEWLMTEHAAYSTRGMIDRVSKVPEPVQSDALRASY
jgi:hypothetical protein